MDFIDPILSKQLRRIATDEAGGRTSWEHKTWNIHRGVIHWRSALETLHTEQIFAVVRDHVFATYKMRWWRGFGFGVILEAQVVPRDSQELATLIDREANPEGTWQWLIVACPPHQAAIGLHTWLAGYLAPTYTGLLEAFKAHGYQVASFQAKPPGAKVVS